MNQKELIDPNKSSMATGFNELLHSETLSTEKESEFSSDFFLNLLENNGIDFEHNGEKYFLHLTPDKDIPGRRKILLTNEVGVYLGEMFLFLDTGEWIEGNPSNSTKYESIFKRLKNSEKNTKIALGIDESNEKTSSEIVDILT